MYVVYEKQNGLKGTYHDVLFFFARFTGWLRDVLKGPVKDNGYATYIFVLHVHCTYMSVGISDESSLDECGINEGKRPGVWRSRRQNHKIKLVTNK